MGTLHPHYNIDYFIVTQTTKYCNIAYWGGLKAFVRGFALRDATK